MRCASPTCRSMPSGSTSRRAGATGLLKNPPDPSFSTRLPHETGGRAFAIENLAELPDVAAKIGIELRNQYVLYYSPKNLTRDGKYRRVQVKLVKTVGLPALSAAFRTGCFAPVQ